MTAAQWFAVGALATILVVCLGVMLWMVATSYVRDAYRKAGVRFDDHVDDAIEVAR